MFYPNNDARLVAAEQQLQNPYALRNLITIVHRGQTSPEWLHLYLGRHAPVSEGNITQAALEHPNTKNLVDEYLADPDALVIGFQALHLWHWALPTSPPKFYSISEFVGQLIRHRPLAQQTHYLENHLNTGVQLARSLVHQNLSWAGDSVAHLSAALAELVTPWLLRQFGSRGVTPLALVILPEIGPAETRPDRLLARFPPAPPAGLHRLDQWRMSLLTNAPSPTGALPFKQWQWSTHRHLFARAHIIFGLQEIRHLLHQHRLLPKQALWHNLRPAFAATHTPGLWLAALQQLRRLWQTHADLPPETAQPVRRQIEAEIACRSVSAPAADLLAVEVKPAPPHTFYYRTPQKLKGSELALFQTIAPNNGLPPQTPGPVSVSALPVAEPATGKLGNILWQLPEQRAYGHTLCLLSSQNPGKTAAVEQALRGCLLLNRCAGTPRTVGRKAYQNLIRVLNPANGFDPPVPDSTRTLFNVWSHWFCDDVNQAGGPAARERLLIRTQAINEQANRYLQANTGEMVDDAGTTTIFREFAVVSNAMLAVLYDVPAAEATNHLLREFPALGQFRDFSEEAVNGFVQITDEIQAAEFTRWFEQNFNRLRPQFWPNSPAVENVFPRIPHLFGNEFLSELLALLIFLQLKEMIQARFDIDDQIIALRNLNTLLLVPHRRQISGPPHEFDTLNLLYRLAAQNIDQLIQRMDTDPQVQIELDPVTRQEQFYRGQQARFSFRLTNYSHIPAHNVRFQLKPDGSFEMATLFDDTESTGYHREVAVLFGGQQQAQNLPAYSIVPQGDTLNITVTCTWQRAPHPSDPKSARTLSREIHWSWPVQTVQPQHFTPITMRFSGGDGSPILAPEKFYGADRRGKLVSLAATLIEQPLNYLLWAPKRVGKTTFLYMVRKIILNEDNARHTFGLTDPRFDRLDNYLPAFVSLMRLHKESANANPFYFEILRQVRECVAVRRNEPKIIVEEYAQQLSLTYPGPISVNQVEYELARLLADLNNPNAKILILLDEYDRVYELIHSDIDANVRALLTETGQHTRKVCWIISSTLGLYKQRQIYGSPLFGVLSRLELNPLNRDDVKTLIEDGIPRGQASFARGVIDWIYRDAGGHPYYTQVLCKNLVDYLNQTGSNFVSFEILQTVGRQLME
ncbi:MAG: hypothetical protein D6768_15520, partial [Chloroflexi bacterium]